MKAIFPVEKIEGASFIIGLRWVGQDVLDLLSASAIPNLSWAAAQATALYSKGRIQGALRTENQFFGPCLRPVMGTELLRYGQIWNCCVGIARADGALLL